MIAHDLLKFTIQYFHPGTDIEFKKDDQGLLIKQSPGSNEICYRIRYENGFESEADDFYNKVLEANIGYKDQKYLAMASLYDVLMRYKQVV